MTDLVQILRLEGQDRASAVIKEVTASLAALERQATRTSKALKGGFSVGLSTPSGGSATPEVRSIQKVATARARAAGDAIRNAGKVWRIRERSEKAGLAGIVSTGKAWSVDQQRRMRMMDRSAAIEIRRQREMARAEARAVREVATARMQAERNTYRDIRNRWAVRERSERQERREVEQRAKLAASEAANQAKAESRASDRRIRDVGRVWRARERSEAAEVRHVRTMARERAAMRREAMHSARDAGRHGRHAARSLNHPVHESVGFALSAGAAAGAAFAGHVVQASEAFDSSMARLKMFAPQLDADAIRKQALGDSITLGVDASKLVDSIAKSVRDGVPPEIAKTLPKSIVSAAQVMGGDVEQLTDSLAEGLQEAFSMGWLKTSTDARRFLNTEAGLSTFAGNTAAKQEQFIAAGGLGHGKEMGIDMTSTLAYGAMLNASGARTGQASARFMGQLSQNVPRMYDRYRQATTSHKNSEEDRAIRSAPGQLGYGGVREMQHRIMAGPEGLIDFATKLQKLDDKTRKLVLEGYGFSEQGGAMLAELGANGGAKGKAVLARAKELAEQKEADDYLSEKFGQWQKSLSNMLRQIEAGWRAIENEVGDVIKSDIVAPLRDWWVQLSGAIVHSDLKDRIHRAIMSFVRGLGFEDVRHLLDTMTANARGFDFAGFARGVGEGIRAVVDNLRSLGSVFGGASGLSAETVGRVATEMLGLSLALKAVSPVLTVLIGIVESFRALSAVLATARGLGFLMGVAGAGEGAGALATLGAGAAATGVGLAAMLGVAVVGGALAVAIMNWDAIKRAMFGGPQETPEERAARPVRRLEDQTWWQFLSGAPKESIPLESDNSRSVDRHKGLFHRNAYDGAGFGDLRKDISWSPSDSGDIVRDATVDTARGVVDVRDAVNRLGVVLRTATLSGSGSGSVAGFGGGGGEGGGNANIRYGRGAAGGYRSTPGTGSYGNPSKSLLDLIAQSEGAGYNVSWGNGRFLPGGKEQNLTGKSLNEILSLGDAMRRQPGARNSSALGRYQLTGQTIRELMGRLHLNGSEKFDEAMQDRLASKLISDEGPRALNRWEGLKRGGYMARAQGLLRSNSIAPQPGDTSLNGTGGGNAGKAVDIAIGMQGAGERSAQTILGAYMHPGEWCADFVNGTLKRAGVTGSGSAMARSFSGWGRHVDAGNVQKGDVIEENAHGRGVNHVGLATGNVKRDRDGSVTHVEMISGNYGNKVTKNWERVGIIADLRRSNEAVTTAAKRVIEQTKPADIARKVHRGIHPGAGDAMPARDITADNSMVNHFHIHGAHDAHHVGRTVVAHLDRANARYTDGETVA